MDQATIVAAQRGDRVAQARLLRSLQDIWFRFCLSQLGSVDLAKEATQETAVRLLRQLAGFRLESRVETWSLGIAINVIRESRRKAGVGGWAEIVGMEISHRLAASDPADTADLNDQSARLKNLISKLPERQREVLVLRFFEEQSVEETAATMGCAAGTVKATLHQALRALRTKLKQPIIGTPNKP